MQEHLNQCIQKTLNELEDPSEYIEWFHRCSDSVNNKPWDSGSQINLGKCTLANFGEILCLSVRCP